MRAARIPVAELLLISWIAAAVVLGYFVAREVRGLRKLGTTVVLAGRSIEQTADALDEFADVPFVGKDARRLAVSAHRTARSAIVNGRAARSDVDSLSALLWLAVAAGSSVPVIAAYAVLRLSRARA
jgi:hypothetical protein